MRETWNRWFNVVTMVLLVVMAGLAVAPSSAVVVPQDDPLREQEFRHPNLWYENVFRPVAELPAGTMRILGSDLSRLGVDPGHAFFDLRTGRWGTLLLVQPMIPGTGVRNDLQWSSLGYDAPPQGEALKQAVWDQFRGYLTEHAAELRIDPQELAEPTVMVIGDRLIQIHAGRTIDGVPVRDTFVKAALNSGNLVLYGVRNWGPVEVSTAPGLSAADAENVVREHVESFPFASLREEPHLELIPTSNQPEEAATFLGAGIEYRLAWVLTPDFEDHLGAWEALVDAHSGELLSFVDTNHYASRRVEGWIYPVANDGIPPDGVMQPGFPMPFADITLDGTDVGFTTTGGNAPTGSDAGVMATTLSGQFVRMNDSCGAINESAAAGDLDLEGLPFPATDCEVPAGHSAGDTQASRTGFYELNRLTEQARGYLPDNTWLQQQLTSNMNLPQTCNAFWNGSTVNFFRSAIPQGCRNTGEIAGVFDHEWGHGMDDNDGNPNVSNPGEGIADIFAHNRLNTSCIGRGFFTDSVCNGYGDPCVPGGCTGIRDIDYEGRVSGQPHDIAWIDANCGGGPAPCGGIVHCEGAVYAEAEYDLVHRDLQGFEGSPFNLDPNTALEIGTRLTFYGSSNVGNWYQCTTDGTGGCNADGGYLGFLAADDDNGDITDGTPHMSAIFAAFDRHQISCNVPAVQDSGCAGGPTEAPANVVADTFDEGVQLTWDAVAGAEEYWIFRTEGVHGCDFGKALIGKTTDTTFSETGLRNGFEVFYSVSAVGASDACVSPMSECLSVIPTAGPSGFIEGTVTDADTGTPIAGAGVEAVGPVTVGDETDADGFYRILAPIGTYDVTADAEDYDPETVTGIEVTEGGTEVVDFALTLTPVPIADISPDSFSFAVQQGDTGSDTLNMGNIGVLDLVWSIAEDDVPAPATQPVMLEEWSDNFDSYDTGSELHGQGGWKGWLNDPAFGALTSDVQAQSTPNSAEIVGDSDLVHEYTGSDSGQWTYTAWQFIPTDFTGTSMFIMLNSYDDSGSGLNWSIQAEFRGAEEQVVNAGASGGTLPLIRGQWVELRVEIDLEADTQDFFYNGELLYSGTWTNEVSGGGQANIGAVDLFANGASPVYYDDMSLTDVTVAPPCTEPSDVPWLSVNPTSGTTPPDSTVPVDVTVDTAGLDEGDVSAVLCATTNDPDAELVQIPVNLTVLPAGGPVADVSPDSFTFTVEQGDSDDDTLNLGNLGGQGLTWDIDEAESALLPVIVPEGAPYRYDLAETPAFNAPVGGSRASGITRSRGEAPADRVVLPAPQAMAVGDFIEGFDDITTLPGAGWALINNSEPVGPSSWFQGNETIFPSHDGDPDAYIAANYESAADGGDVSNWLLTPEVTIVNGTTACFWTRTTDQFEEFYDRLEVRMSIAGASTDVGDTAESVGDFTDLLLSINPDLMPNEYPEDWTEFCVTVRERSREPVTGRFAFRYWVTDTSVNGDYIGIDTVSVKQPDGEVPPDCDTPVDIPWLAVDPSSGTTPPLSSVPADVNVTAGDLDIGQYTAQLCVNTNDPDNPQISVPVTLNVVEDNGIPDILLVDDDDNLPDVQSFFTDALDGLGQLYDIWDTENSDNEPTPADLEPYDAVIWFTGVEFGGFAGPGPDGEASLGTWLDDGGCLFLSSQDYLFDRGETPFMTNYLGMGVGQSDVGQTEVTGAGSVFGGLGPYTLVYPFSNFSDLLTPDGTAELAFSGNAGDAAINKDSGTYKTTFWGFPFPALPDAVAREEAMVVALDWCGVASDTGFIEGTVTDLTNGGPLEDATVTAGTRSTQTGADGTYSMRLPVGTYDVTASKDNYVPMTVPGVEVVLDQTTTVDFELEGSTLAYDPAAIEQSMESGDVVSTTVTLTATGPLPVDFEVSFGNFEGPTASQPLNISVPPSDGRFQRVRVKPSALAAPADGRPVDGATTAPVEIEQLLGTTAYAQNAAFGFYTVFDVDVPEVLPNVAPLDTGDFIGAGEFVDGVVYNLDASNNLVGVDPATGAEVSSTTVAPPGGSQSWTGLALDPTSGDVYASSCDLSTSQLFTMDLSTGEWTSIGSISGSPCTIGIAIDGTGTLYGYDLTNDSLLSIDKSTAEGTIIGPLGFDANFGQGMAWDPASDQMLLAAFNAATFQAELRVADRTTGNTALVGVLGQTDPGGTSQLGYMAIELSTGPVWASADPPSGTVEPGVPFTMEVIFDATQLVQEGTYTADMNFSGSFVNDVPTMPLTMHLTCPVCGTLDGAITDDVSGDPVEATITVEGDGGFTTSQTGETYSITAPADTYTITAEADGYFPETVEGVVLGAGETVTTDFALTFMFADLEYTPASIEADMEPGDVVTTPVTVTNSGTIPLEFSVNFRDFEAPGVSQPRNISLPPSDGNFPRGDLAPSALAAPADRQPVPGAASAPADLAQLLGTTAYAQNAAVNVYTIFDVDVPEVLPNIAPLNTGNFVGAGEFFDGSVYMLDAGNLLVELDPATGAEISSTTVTPPGGSQSWTGLALDPTSGEVYASSCDITTSQLFTMDLTTGEWTSIGAISNSPCTIGIAIDGSGTLYGYDLTNDSLLSIDKSTAEGTIIGSLGFDANFGQGMAWDPATDSLYLAAFNAAAFAAELRIADRSTGNTTLVGVLGQDDPGGTNQLGLMAIELSTGPQWASADPASGTVEPGDSFTFDVIFDAAELVQVGTYTANMRFSGNFSNDPPDMPLTLNLTCPTCGTLDGSITDDMTGDPVEATVTVEGDGGFTATQTGETYSMTAPADTYTISVEADGYFPETVEGVVLGAGDTVTTDFALTPQIAVLEYTPASIEETLPPDGTATNTVTVTNSGTIPLDFSVSFRDFESPTAQPLNISLPPSDGNFPRGKSAPSALAAPADGRPVPGAASVPAELGQLLGTTAYAQNAAVNVYTVFDVDVPEVLPNVAPLDTGNFVGAGEFVNGSVYMLDAGNLLVELDPATGAEISSMTVAPPGGSQSWTGMALDPTTGDVYASSCDITTSQLFILDVSTGEWTLIGTITNSPCTIGIAIDGTGTLYGFDLTNDSLLSIDKSTAEGTIIGPLGFDANFGQGMAWDPATDSLYLAAFNAAAFLPELRIADRDTGNTTLVGVLGQDDPGGTNQLGLMAIELSTTPPWATAVPDSGTVEPGGEFTLDVTFDAAVTEDGPGTYTANMRFNSNASNDPPDMPLTLNVEGDGGGDSEPLELGAFELDSLPNGGQLVEITVPGGVVNPGDVTGFSFIGTVSGITGSSSWASDTCMMIEAPDGTTYVVGGFTGVSMPGCYNAASEEGNPWDFQGLVSDEDGTYESVHDGIFDPTLEDEGDWIFTFVNDWESKDAATQSWTDVTVSLLKTTAPSTIPEDAFTGSRLSANIN